MGLGSRHIGTAARGSTSREHSEPSSARSPSPSATDVASPKLFLDAVAGKLDSKVEIKFTTTTKGKVDTFLTYETGRHRSQQLFAEQRRRHADGVAVAEFHQDHETFNGTDRVSAAARRRSAMTWPR